MNKYIQLLCLTLTTLNSMIHAMEEIGITQISTIVRQPTCISYLAENFIAIGGDHGIELFNQQGTSICRKYSVDSFSGIIYQLLPQKKAHYIAVDKKESHHIDLYHMGIHFNEPNEGNFFYLDEHDQKQKHNTSKNMLSILLYPHRNSMPKNIPTDKCLSVTMRGKIIALLTVDSILQFWLCDKEENKDARLVGSQSITFDVSEKLDATSGITQRLSFSPGGLFLAVVLKTSGFVIAVPFEVFTLTKK